MQASAWLVALDLSSNFRGQATLMNARIVFARCSPGVLFTFSINLAGLQTSAHDLTLAIKPPNRVPQSIQGVISGSAVPSETRLWAPRRSRHPHTWPGSTMACPSPRRPRPESPMCTNKILLFMWSLKPSSKTAQVQNLWLGLSLKVSFWQTPSKKQARKFTISLALASVAHSRAARVRCTSRAISWFQDLANPKVVLLGIVAGSCVSCCRGG